MTSSSSIEERQREADARSDLTVRRYRLDGPISKEDPWPSPDEHVGSVVTGELADRIRSALEVTDINAKVTVIETTAEGGHSEHTAEWFNWVTVKSSGKERTFTGDSTRNAFVKLLDWMDARERRAERR